MNNTVKLQRQCVQLGSINCDSVSPALQMKVAAGALDKPQIKGMVLQVLTTDRCALLIPPGCFLKKPVLLSVHVFVTAGGMRRYLQLIQAGSGHGFISSRMAHPYRPAHSQECDGSLKTELDGALFAPLCEEEQSELLCSSLTELSDPESTRGRRPAVRQTPCSWINVLLVSLQCNGCFLDTLISAKFSWLCVILQWSGKNHHLSECEPQMWVIRTFGIKIIIMATVKLLTFIQECIPLSYSVPDNLNLWLHLSWPTHSDHHS